jgi:hypothetical protein
MTDQAELIIDQLETMSTEESRLNRALVIWVGTLVVRGNGWPADDPMRRRAAIVAGRAALEHEDLTGLVLLACRELDSVLFACTSGEVDVNVVDLDELNALRVEIGAPVNG